MLHLLCLKGQNTLITTNILKPADGCFGTESRKDQTVKVVKTSDGAANTGIFNKLDCFLIRVVYQIKRNLFYLLI